MCRYPPALSDIITLYTVTKLLTKSVPAPDIVGKHRIQEQDLTAGLITGQIGTLTLNHLPVPEGEGDLVETAKEVFKEAFGK